ncbi:MAG TPA: NlpC/P60 family protein [Acidimicrobiia bacterium]
MNLRAARLVPIIIVGLATPAVLATSALASPVDDKRAQAERLQAEISANGAKTDALSEQYNGAQLKLNDAKQAVAAAQIQTVAAQQRTRQLQRLLADRAASIYMSSGVSNGIAVLDADNARDINAREKYSSAAASRDDTLIQGLRNAKELLARKQADAEQAQQAAQHDAAAISSAKHQLDAANGTQHQLLGQVNGEIKTLVAQAAQQQAVAEAAAAQKRFAAGATARLTTGPATTRGGGGGRGNAPSIAYPTNLPSPSGGAAAAIAFARAQLGKPYQYAATGPGSYDCSGLTMRAWEAGGVSMPHYSGAQYAMFPKVPLDQLQPGDLVFRGAGGSQHVSLYIGGGLVITAPQTGDVVKVAGIGSVMGAVRPG